MIDAVLCAKSAPLNRAAFEAGRLSFTEGGLIDQECPYHLESADELEWFKGYLSAAKDFQPEFFEEYLLTAAACTGRFEKDFL